jgi:hypothetical protein
MLYKCKQMPLDKDGTSENAAGDQPVRLLQLTTINAAAAVCCVCLATSSCRVSDVAGGGQALLTYEGWF